MAAGARALADTHGTIAVVYGRCEWEEGRADREAKWARLREETGLSEAIDRGDTLEIDESEDA